MKTHSPLWPNLALGLALASALTFTAGAAQARTPCAHHSAVRVVHHASVSSHSNVVHAHRAATRHSRAGRLTNVAGADEKYLQAPVEHLGDDETTALGSVEYKGWASEYDYAAKDRICSGNPASDANAHLLRGCLHRFHEQQKLDAYWTS
ncbi:hypothetical protein [Burkholderia cenocepacia]|uniref:hypothetical protein n=1 Tax=Burkholderia cenocepacia TaxID=95486 RepID=UPI00076CED82|nr:hypothetical protein [Burkholderia cenocepacia]KWU17854.1 hypothetical protein AS149_14130 [Burkholderia cenocepacia]